MKIYAYYLKGTQVNGQFSSNPVWFKFAKTKYVLIIRVWRFQLALRVVGCLFINMCSSG